VRQPQRDARQGGIADASAANGGGIDVRQLSPAEVARVDALLPLHRLDGAQTYLVAWLGDEPVGHAHVAWAGTKLGMPEIQDVFVEPRLRRQGVATALSRGAEREAVRRGHDRISLSVGIGNEAAQRLYERLGYADAGIEPQRVQGTITLRGEPFDVDDTLLYLVKSLPVVRPLDPRELRHVHAALPRGPAIHEDRLGAQERGEGVYLFVWGKDQPLGHAYLSWSGRLDHPEVRDVGVTPGRRREGQGTLLMDAAEELARARGAERLGLAVALDNHVARAFYERLEYVDAGVEPFTISYEAWDGGGSPHQVTETCTYLRKELGRAVDSGSPRSS
jgi:ribosomal protein S18 acetylase RimI-like enzyme